MSDTAQLPSPAEWYADVPRSVRRHAIFGITLMIATFGGFGVWAFKAPLAAAIIAQGSFVATGQNKIVQHLEGGIIKDILVQEGDAVAEGQVLVHLDETIPEASKRELHLRRVRLEATQARLQAQHDEAESLQYAAWLAEAAGDPEIDAILQSQRLSFDVGRAGLNTDVSMVARNIEAIDLRKRGYEIQLASLRGQVELLQEELDSKSRLLQGGLAVASDVSSLRRALLDAQGDIGRMESEIAEMAEMRERFESQIERTRSEYKRTALAELQSVQAELESVREQARQAENVLARTDVVAPVEGTVVRLHYHTTGGVIESGRPIAEILPATAPLIVEVLVKSRDIDSVRVGQPATVRLIALNQRTTPILNGEVSYVSADSMADTSQGSGGGPREVYVARVSLPAEELQRVPGFTPTPGMPAEIMIQTRERTFAEYLARPVIDSMARAFREQ